jgi:hypothetical protein
MGYWFIVLLALSIAYTAYRIIKKPGDMKASVSLFVSAVFFSFLAFDGVWARIVQTLPILGVEIYPWRFLFISLFTLIAFVIIGINEFLSKLKVSKSIIKDLLSLLIFVPVVLVMYSRNQYFVEIGTENYDPIPEYSIEYFFRQNNVIIFEDEKTDINNIYLFSENVDLYELDWIDTKFQNEFEIQNGELKSSDIDSGIVIQPIDTTKPVIIKPDDFGAVPLLVVSFLFYILLIIVWIKRSDIEKPV